MELSDEMRATCVSDSFLLMIAHGYGSPLTLLGFCLEYCALLNIRPKRPDPLNAPRKEVTRPSLCLSLLAGHSRLCLHPSVQCHPFLVVNMAATSGLCSLIDGVLVLEPVDAEKLAKPRDPRRSDRHEGTQWLCKLCWRPDERHVLQSHCGSCTIFAAKNVGQNGLRGINICAWFLMA